MLKNIFNFVSSLFSREYSNIGIKKYHIWNASKILHLFCIKLLALGSKTGGRGGACLLENAYSCGRE